MSIGLENLANVTAVSAAYPWKDIKDDTGAGDGTPLNQISHSDYHQTFRKLLDKAYLAPNGLPDNVTNGYQYVDALKFLYKNFRGVVPTSVGIILDKHFTRKVIYIDSATTLTGFIMPSSADLDDTDSITIVNKTNYEVVMQGDGTDTVDLSASVSLLASGDFAELVLDKGNGNWVLVNYKITPFSLNIITVGSGGSAPSLLNSWIAAQTVKFFIDERDFINLEGAVHKTGSIGGGDTIFVLPASYRPTSDKTVIVKCIDSGVKRFIPLTIFTTGQVAIDFTLLTGSTDTYVWIQCISFYKNW